MKRALKVFTACLVLSGFSLCAFAQQVSYKFSGFGGGLPSSATVCSADTDLDSINNDNAAPEKPKMSKKKKALIITASVVGGVLVIGGIAVGTYFLIGETGKCCDSLGESCTAGCSDALSQSISESCNNAGGISSIVKGMSIIPIYVP